MGYQTWLLGPVAAGLIAADGLHKPTREGLELDRPLVSERGSFGCPFFTDQIPTLLSGGVAGNVILLSMRKPAGD
jgi:hypothetical protein